MNLSWLKNAFAVEKPGPAPPSDVELAALEPLLAEVVRRRMVGPALISLEAMRGLNSVGAQAMHFFQPFATAVLDPVRYGAIASYMEKRGAIDWLCQELTRRESAGNPSQ